MAKRKPTRTQGSVTAASVSAASWQAIALAAVGFSAPILWYLVAIAAGMTTRAQGVDISAALLGLAGTVSAAVLMAASAPLRLRRFELAWGALLVLALGSGLTSGRGWTALAGEVDSGLGLLSMVAFALIVVASVQQASALRPLLVRIAPWIVLGEVGLLAFQLAQGSASAAGTLPNSTYLGELIVLMLPWVLVGWSGSARGSDAWKLWVALAGVIALAASGSRTALIVAVVWLGWELARRLAASKVVRGAVVTLLALAAGAVALLFARSEVLGSATLATLGERPAMWRAAILGTLARPVQGWGPDGFVAGGSAGSTVEAARAGTLLVMQPGGQPDPHSALAWVAVSLGFLGIALVAWIVFETFRETRPGLGDRDIHVVPGLWALGMCGVVALTAPAAIQVLPVVALVWGAAVGAAGDRGSVVDAPAIAVRLASAALAVACLVGVANSVTRAPLEVADAQRSPVLNARAQAAAGTWPFDAHLAFIASRHASFSVVDASTKDSVLGGLARAADLDGRNPYYPLYLAVALRDSGGVPQQIEAAFDDAIARYPFHPFARVERAVYWMRSSQAAKAETDLEVAGLADKTQVPEIAQMIEQARATGAQAP